MQDMDQVNIYNHALYVRNIWDKLITVQIKPLHSLSQENIAVLFIFKNLEAVWIAVWKHECVSNVSLFCLLIRLTIVLPVSERVRWLVR